MRGLWSLIIFLLSLPVFAANKSYGVEQPVLYSSSTTLNGLVGKAPEILSEEDLNAMFDGTQSHGDADVVHLTSNVAPYEANNHSVFYKSTGYNFPAVPVPMPAEPVGEIDFINRLSTGARLNAAMEMLGNIDAGAELCRAAGASVCDLKFFEGTNVKIKFNPQLEGLGQTSKNGNEITIELSGKLLSMSNTQLAIVLGHELGHAGDIMAFPSLALPFGSVNPDPLSILSETKAALDNIVILKELEDKGLVINPLTPEEKLQRFGIKIALAAWESKNTGKKIPPLSNYKTGNAEFDKQLETHYALCSNSDFSSINSFKTIVSIGLELGYESALGKIINMYPKMNSVERDVMLSGEIEKKEFSDHFKVISRKIQRKDADFIKNQYGREGKLGLANYDPNREPIYIKKANVGLGLWGACDSAPKIQDQIVLQLREFGLSLNEEYVTELEGSLLPGACQKKLLRHIRDTKGFAGITADWLNYVVTHGFNDPPVIQPSQPGATPPAAPNPTPAHPPVTPPVNPDPPTDDNNGDSDNPPHDVPPVTGGGSGGGGVNWHDGSHWGELKRILPGS